MTQLERPYLMISLFILKSKYYLIICFVSMDNNKCPILFSHEDNRRRDYHSVICLPLRPKLAESTGLMYTPSLPTSCTHPLYQPHAHTLSTNLMYTPSLPTSCTHVTLSTNLMYTPSVSMVCTHHCINLMYTPSTCISCTHPLHASHVHTLYMHIMYTPSVSIS